MAASRLTRLRVHGFTPANTWQTRLQLVSKQTQQWAAKCGEQSVHYETGISGNTRLINLQLALLYSYCTTNNNNKTSKTLFLKLKTQHNTSWLNFNKCPLSTEGKINVLLQLAIRQNALWVRKLMKSHRIQSYLKNSAQCFTLTLYRLSLLNTLMCTNPFMPLHS